VEERNSLRKDKSAESGISEQLIEAEKAAAAARKVVENGELTNWGQRPLPLAATQAKTDNTPKRADDEPDKPTTLAKDKNMSEKEIQYWLAKDVKYPDTEPESTGKLMGQVFSEKEYEATQLRALRSLQQMNATVSAKDEVKLQTGVPQISGDQIINPKKSIEVATAKAEDDAAELALGQTPKPPESNPSRKKSKTEIKSNKEDIQTHEKIETEKARKTAQNATKLPPPKPPKPEKPAKNKGSDPEKAQKKDALGLSTEDYDSDVLADRVMEADNIGDSIEGVDEANADGELDDMAVEAGVDVDDEDEAGVDES